MLIAAGRPTAPCSHRHNMPVLTAGGERRSASYRARSSLTASDLVQPRVKRYASSGDNPGSRSNSVCPICERVMPRSWHSWRMTRAHVHHRVVERFPPHATAAELFEIARRVEITVAAGA